MFGRLVAVSTIDHYKLLNLYIDDSMIVLHLTHKVVDDFSYCYSTGYFCVPALEVKIQLKSKLSRE